jgi:hypothetical protein
LEFKILRYGGSGGLDLANGGVFEEIERAEGGFVFGEREGSAGAEESLEVFGDWREI